VGSPASSVRRTILVIKIEDSLNEATYQLTLKIILRVLPGLLVIRPLVLSHASSTELPSWS
jgi:hypothetical protein